MGLSFFCPLGRGVFCAFHLGLGVGLVVLFDLYLLFFLLLTLLLLLFLFLLLLLLVRLFLLLFLLFLLLLISLFILLLFIFLLCFLSLVLNSFFLCWFLFGTDALIGDDFLLLLFLLRLHLSLCFPSCLDHYFLHLLLHRCHFLTLHGLLVLPPFAHLQKLILGLFKPFILLLLKAHIALQLRPVDLAGIVQEHLLTDCNE